LATTCGETLKPVMRSAYFQASDEALVDDRYFG